MRACAAEAGEPSRSPRRRAWCRAGEGELPILLPHGYRHYRDHPERNTPEKDRHYQVRYRCCCAATH